LSPTGHTRTAAATAVQAGARLITESAAFLQSAPVTDLLAQTGHDFARLVAYLQSARAVTDGAVCFTITRQNQRTAVEPGPGQTAGQYRATLVSNSCQTQRLRAGLNGFAVVGANITVPAVLPDFDQDLEADDDVRFVFARIEFRLHYVR